MLKWLEEPCKRQQHARNKVKTDPTGKKNDVIGWWGWGWGWYNEVMC